MRVIQPGTVKVGDKMTLQNDSCGSLSVANVHSLFGAEKNNTMLLKMAVKETLLAKDCKDALQVRLQKSS